MAKRRKKPKKQGKQNAKLGIPAHRKRILIEQYLAKHPWMGINEAKRKLKFKGVHPKRKPKTGKKHTITMYQEGTHRTEEKKK